MVAFTGDVYRYHASAWTYVGDGAARSATFAAALTQTPDP